jgi:shikimate dehydrogenase
MMPNKKTIYGLIGFPVKHSLSPAMHNAAFAKLGIKADYRLFEVAPKDLESFLGGKIKLKDTEGQEFPSAEVRGFNITVPHKVQAREILTKKFPPAGREKIFPYVKISGAINTVKRLDGGLEYWNTDVSGFYRSLKKDLGFDCRNKTVFLVGCGGAGMAVIASLIWKEALGVKKIYVYDLNKIAVDSAKRHFSQFTETVSEKISFISKEEISKVIQECSLLVNATTVGMREGDGSAVDKDLLHSGLYVYDVIYNRETQLIKDARSCGLPCADGLGMLLYQGAASFEFWTGREAPLEAMRRALSYSTA